MSLLRADAAPPFAGLTPDSIIEAIESVGLSCDGRLLALNSYENRVYRVGVEDAEPVVVKFYRQARWSDAAILEEHEFSAALAALDIQVVAPLAIAGHTLHSHAGFRFAFYPMRNGRAAELEDAQVLTRVGRLVGRLHNVGASGRFQHRPSLDLDRMGRDSRAWLLEHECLPAQLLPAYSSVSADLLGAVQNCFARVGPTTTLRLHGDAHPGNLLAREEQLLLVDLDDAINGPAIQDLWLFLAGDRYEQARRLAPLLAGYTEFRTFDARELGLIEALRSLRIMYHAAWLARRWDDPAFPIAFPWFEGPRFWDEHVLALREQLALIDEPAPRWDPFQ